MGELFCVCIIGHESALRPFEVPQGPQAQGPQQLND